MANHRTDVEILNAAMDWFDTHQPVGNWAHMFEYKAGEICRACIIGALKLAVGKEEIPTKVLAAIYGALKMLFPGRTFAQPFTKPEIRKLYRKAINLALKPRRHSAFSFDFFVDFLMEYERVTSPAGSQNHTHQSR